MSTALSSRQLTQPAPSKAQRAPPKTTRTKALVQLKTETNVVDRETTSLHIPKCIHYIENRRRPSQSQGLHFVGVLCWCLGELKSCVYLQLRFE